MRTVKLIPRKKLKNTLFGSHLRAARNRRAFFEPLEDRTVLSTIIDVFTDPQTIAVSGPSPASLSSSVSGAGILGVERDATVTVNVSPNATRFSTFSSSGGLASISNNSDVSGSLRLVYDGIDGSAAIVPGGLGGQNLADDSTFFQIIGDSNLGSNVAITVFTYNGSSYVASAPVSQALPSDPAGTSPTTLTYNFSSFAGANFSNVGAIVVDISPLTGNLGMSTSIQAFTTQGTPQADLSVTKTGNVTTTTAGTNTTYTVTISNAGPGAAQSVQLTDAIPAGATFVSASQSSGPTFSTTNPPVGGTGTITESIASLTSGASASFVFVIHANANAPAGSLITNTASASSTTSDPNNANNSATDTDTVATSAEVSLTKTGPATVTAGANVTYTITASNSGPSDAQSVALTDSLPAGTSFVSQSQSSGPAFALTNPGGNVSDSIASLPAGASASFVLVVQANSNGPAGSLITNTGNISSATSDPNPANNTSSRTSTVATSADLQINKTGSATVAAGSTGVYTITVSNAGPSDSQNLSLSDSIPAGATFAGFGGATNWDSASTPPSGPISASEITLPAGATVTLAYTLDIAASVPGGSVLSNTATVTSSTADPTTPNTTTFNSTVATTTDISVTKTGPASVIPGQNLTYTVSISNAGPIDAQSVSLTDTVPPGTTFVSTSQSSGPAFTSSLPSVGGTGTITESIATLTSGSSATFVIVVSSNSSLAGGAISNTATGAASNDTTPANNSQTSTTNVSAAQADVNVLKTGPATVTAGTNVTYTVTLSNSGPSDAQTFRLTDAVPAGTTFVSECSSPAQHFQSPIPAPGGAGTITGSIATLSAGASASFQIVVQATSSGGPAPRSTTPPPSRQPLRTQAPAAIAPAATTFPPPVPRWRPRPTCESTRPAPPP